VAKPLIEKALMREDATPEEVRILDASSLMIAVRGPDGLYGIQMQAFTWAIMCKVTMDSYERRYCYDTMLDAIMGLAEWEIGREPHPSGPWLKLKGLVTGGRGHADFRQDQIDADGVPYRIRDDGLVGARPRGTWNNAVPPHYDPAA